MSVRCAQLCPADESQNLLSTNIEHEGELEESAYKISSSAPSVIQFTTAIYYCEEDEGKASIDIVRLGDATGPACCSWCTEEASSKAGINYTHCNGKVFFAPGDTLKGIDVPLITSPAWNATLEFKLSLTDVRGAFPGRYLKYARVRVIDADCFPTNKFSKRIRADEIEHIPGFALMLEFVKLVLQDSRLLRDTIKWLALQLIWNMYFFMTLYLQLYLVDAVLAGDDRPEEEGRRLLAGIKAAARFLSHGHHHVAGKGAHARGDEEEASLAPTHLIIDGDRQKTALVIGLLYVMPFAALHIIDQWRCFLSVPAGVRKMVQLNLMRKFVNYKEEVRQTVRGSELIMTMIRDVREVSDMGFMKILSLLGTLGKLSLALIFILTENKMGAIPLVVYPVVLGITLALRERMTIHHMEERARRQDIQVDKLDEVVSNIRLISDFHMKETVVDSYECIIDAYHDQEAIASSYLTTNVYVALWVGTMLIGGYMALGASLVEDVGDGIGIGAWHLDPVSLGTFLATINVFKEVGAELQEIYNQILEIQISIGPLQKIVRYMNLETDLMDRKKFNRKRRAEGIIRRTEARKSHDQSTGDPFAVDKVEISITNLKYGYEDPRTGTMQYVIYNYNGSFEQGKLYAFVGKPREGKATLLQLIGLAICPLDGYGEIFVPPHLRIMHVARDVELMHCSFLDNILLGTSLEQAGGIDRVLAICRRVGFTEKQVLHISVDTETSSPHQDSKRHKEVIAWKAHFSETDFARLNLARIFAANPEMLCVHKPTALFDDNDRSKMMALLREHVEHKGLELPDKDRRFRRPRTVFFSTEYAGNAALADKAYEVSLENGLSEWDVSKAVH